MVEIAVVLPPTADSQCDMDLTSISEVAYIEEERNPLVRTMEYSLRLITEATWTLSGIDSP